MQARFQILGHEFTNNSNDTTIITDVKFDKFNIDINANKNEFC